MTRILRQSTEVIVPVGTFVDVGDGFTPETGITLGAADEAELLKAAGAATVDISGNTFAAVSGCDGTYHLTLTASNTDTVGPMRVVVQDDSVCLPVWQDFFVVEEAIFDMLYASGAQMTESYAADGTAPTLPQAIYLIMQRLMSFAISGTTVTVRKIDDSTTAATFTMNDAINPSSVTRTT